MVFSKIRLWWRKRQHVHSWRPASARGYPAMLCKDCGRCDVINRAAFYAQFGRDFDHLTAVAKGGLKLGIDATRR